MYHYTKRIWLFFMFSSLLGVIFLTGCHSNEPVTTEPLSRTEFVLGTVATISIYDHQSEEILELAANRLYELEDTLSINKVDTLIDEINEQAGIAPVKVDADTFKVIEKALSYSKLTDGAFDISVGPIVKLWNIGFPNARIPSSEEIASTIPLVGFDKVVLNAEDSTVYLEEKGMQLDLGGIGKGYAADEIADLLRSQGVEHALIDLGGNLYTLGTKVDGSMWNIGVQDPFNPRGKIIGRLTTADQSIVTSGIYERFIEDEFGHKYHHILDPKTGYPYENEIAGVTIVSKYSIDGDALSTSVFALGIEKGLEFLESQPDVEAIFVTTDYKVYITEGLRDTFTLTNDAFTLAN